jgi:tetratricopeptide (TPR) repeat protein
MQITENKYSWCDLPEDVKNFLDLATQNWENTTESEKYINQALAEAGDHPDVLIAAYRFFFYKNNPSRALQVAEKVIENVKKSENLPDDWEELKPILANRLNDPEIRLYLNAYAASGFVLAKLGQLEKAKEITGRVKEIDDKKEFGGGSTVFDVLTKPDDDDEYE